MTAFLHTPLPRLPFTIHPSSSSSSSSPISCSSTPPSTTTLNSVAARLQKELPTLFTTATPDFSIYSTNVIFEDPLTKFKGTNRYQTNISFLRNSPVFTSASLSLYDTCIISNDTVRTRWMLKMIVAFLPWKPLVTFTGQSDYLVNNMGQVVKHVDYWDSLSDSTYFSFEGVKDLVAQCAWGRVTVGKIAPFELLRRNQICEIRKFQGEGVTIVKSGDGWTIANSEEGVVLSLVAARAVGKEQTANVERTIRESLRGVTYASVGKRAFVVSFDVGVSVVKEVWVELEGANVDVDAY